MNVFEGTGVKRYALRSRDLPWEPWEYPPDLQFDTVEEALEAQESQVEWYEVAERFINVRYLPGTEYTPSTLLDRLLKLFSLRPYILQTMDGRGWWYTCISQMFDTAQAAQQAAKNGPYRVAAAVLDEHWEPVRKGVYL